MERNTRSMGNLATGENKRVQPDTKHPGGDKPQGQPAGSVQKGHAVGAMTTRNEKATVPNGR